MHDRLPVHLYKYRSVDHSQRKFVERVFTHHELFFSSRTAFNDPFECRATLTMDASKQQFRQYVDRILRRGPPLPAKVRKERVSEIVRQRHERIPSDLKKLMDGVERMLDSQIGILCLSAKPDDILMWSHYAASHTGICLRFSTERTTSPFRNAQPVRYQGDFPKGSIITTPPAELQHIVAYTKAEAWRYEEEWRLIDHGTGPGVKQFDPRDLTGVILGARIAHEDRRDVLAWAAKHATPLDVLSATISRDRYAVDLVPVPHP